MIEPVTPKAKPAYPGDESMAYCPYQQDGCACYTNCALYHADRQACAHLVRAQEAGKQTAVFQALGAMAIDHEWGVDTPIGQKYLRMLRGEEEAS